MTDTRLKSILTLYWIEQSVKSELSATEACSISLNGVYILNALYRKDGQRASDLAKAIGVLPTGFTPMLDPLERAGFVRRSANLDDRRSVLIFLTKQGLQLRTVIERAIGNAEVRYGGG